jgi:phage terminase large subunit
VIVNDVYIPYLTDQHRILVLYGGAGSGKSVFAAQKIICRIKSESGHKFLALRKVARTVKDSVYAELIDVIRKEGMEHEFKINKSEYSFTHLPTGNQILCKGLDEPEKIKSVQGITGMWLEEVTEFAEEDLDQLQVRVRGEKPNYVQFIYTFNPINEDNHVVKKYIVKKLFDPELVHVLKTTYKDNYFLSEEDKAVLEGYKETNELFYQVYCLGEPGVVDRTNKFFYNFDADVHVADCGKVKGKTLKLSFDFNLEPFACLAYQASNTGLRFFEEIRLENSDIYAMCDYIKANYPDDFYVATGDRTGYNRTGVVRGKTSYWEIIKKELSLSDAQLKLRAKNLDHVQSRVLCNAALKFKNIIIDSSCETLIEDCKFAQVDDKGELIKDRKKNKNDFGDCFRYALDAEYPELIKGFKR